MPQGANGATSTGNGSGNGSGTRTRESKTKGVDKKALRRQQEDTEKQPKQKVIEEKAKKAGKRKAEKVRSQEMITRGLKRVGGNRTYQTKPRPMKGEELAWDNGEGNMEIHGEAIEYSLWLQGECTCIRKLFFVFFIFNLCTQSGLRDLEIIDIEVSRPSGEATPHVQR